tara:strand:+ start:6351 stop:7271 length:921 start_codon:yes stop_codon:yes gene_type:complete
MKSCIVGYKNHAKRLEHIVSSLGYTDALLYNHKEDSEESIENCDVFFIASPSDTHYHWIDKLQGLGKYIFCEKPPVVSLSDLQKIESYNSKLYFNFNYRFSKLSEIVSKYISNGDLGKPIYMNCVSATGIAFTKPNNWRFTEKNLFSSVAGNVGIHYIDMMANMFGSIDDLRFENLNVVSKNMPDTSRITLKCKKVFGDILLSYASSFQNEVKVMFDNGCVYLRDGTISVETPRNTFDEDGRFKRPAKKVLFSCKDSKSYYDMSLSDSVKFFLHHAKNNIPLPPEHYNQSIDTTRLILNKIGGNND